MKMKKMMTMMAVLSAFSLSALADVSIGIIGPTSGAVAVYGQAVINGMKLAIDEINANGGVLGGQKIVSTPLDDKGDAVEGINAYNKLKGQKVSAILGPVTSGVVSGVAEKTNADKMVTITPTGTADSLTVNKPYVYRTCYTDSYQAKIAAKFMAQNQNIKKAAVIYCNADEYSLGLYEAFKEGCAEYGIEIVATETSASMDDVDFSAQLGKIAVSDAEALFVPFYYGAVALIVPQARDAGYEGIMVGADGWDGTDVGENQAAFNKCFFTNHYSQDDPAAKVQNFVNAYKAKFGPESLNVFSALGYDTVYLYAQAVNEAKSADSSAVKPVLDKIVFEGVTGKFSFDEQGNPKKGAPIIEFKDGKMTWNTTVE